MIESPLLDEVMAEVSRKAREKALVEGRSEGLQEGRVEGLQEGRVAGLSEGRRDSLRESVIVALTVRFGEPEQPLVDRINTLEEEQELQRLHTTAVRAVDFADFLRQAGY